MALGTDYAGQDCTLARALEVVGERWTLLIVRDSFFGVRRFGDFRDHLDISKAVLAGRLTSLVDNGLMRKDGDDYVPTEDLIALWPTINAMTQWGERRSDRPGPRRLFAHAECGTDLDGTLCPACGVVPHPTQVDMRPGPGADPSVGSDGISVLLRRPRRLLSPIR